MSIDNVTCSFYSQSAAEMCHLFRLADPIKRPHNHSVIYVIINERNAYNSLFNPSNALVSRSCSSHSPFPFVHARNRISLRRYLRRNVPHNPTMRSLHPKKDTVLTATRARAQRYKSLRSPLQTEKIMLHLRNSDYHYYPTIRFFIFLFSTRGLTTWFKTTLLFKDLWLRRQSWIPIGVSATVIKRF